MVMMPASADGPVLAAAIAPIVGSSSLALASNSGAEVPGLPPGFPTRLTGEMAWTGPDFSRTSDYILVLNDAWRAEVNAAVEYYKCKFPLPTTLTCWWPLPLTSPDSLGPGWRPRGASQLSASDPWQEAQGA